MSAPLNARQALLLVARREFVSQVRSRSFVIGLVVTLVLFGGLFVLSGYISDQSSTKSLGLTEQTAPLRPALEQTAAGQDLELTIRDVDDAAGRALVDGEELGALLTGEPGGYELVGLASVDSGLRSVVDTAVRQQTLPRPWPGPVSIRPGSTG